MSTPTLPPPSEAEVAHAFEVLKRHFDAQKVQRTAPARPSRSSRRPTLKTNRMRASTPTDEELLERAARVAGDRR